jgi:hypothetical protein
LYSCVAKAGFQEFAFGLDRDERQIPPTTSQPRQLNIISRLSDTKAFWGEIDRRKFAPGSGHLRRKPSGNT